MTEQITEHINYQKGYDQGYSDAQEYLAKKFDKILSKNSNQFYEKGFREGADQKDNKPCVCGFWGEEKTKK